MSNKLDLINGEINLSNMLNTMREVYRGGDDAILNIMRIIGKGYGYLEACNQWGSKSQYRRDINIICK